MASMKSLHPLALLPGTVFWGCVIAGFATGNDAFFGVAVVVAVLLISTLLFFKIRASATQRAERLRIWTEGAPTTARVISIGTGGGSLNDYPYVDFVLELAEGTPPHRVELNALVSQLAIPRIQPGCQIAVRVDPKDPAKVVIDAELTPYGYR